MNKLKCLYLTALATSLCFCTTAPEPAKILLPKSQSSYQDKNYGSSHYNDIDVNALLIELNLDHPVETLGFQEQAFNTCQISANKSPSPLCQKLYVGRLNFQVMCRHSKGTVEKVNLSPLFSRKLRWKNSDRQGTTSTNARGYGSLGFITPYPSRHGFLYLYLGSKIARKRFADKWKLILPESWCLSR